MSVRWLVTLSTLAVALSPWTDGVCAESPGGAEPTKYAAAARTEDETTLAVRTLAWSADGHWMAAGFGAPDSRGRLRVWDLQRRRQIVSQAAVRGVASVALSANGQRVAWSGWDHVVHLATLGPQGIAEEREIPAGSRVVRLTLSPDGRKLATASDGSELRLWDTATGKELKRCTGDVFRLQCVAFSPDGLLIAAGGGGFSEPVFGRAALWDAETGEQILALEGHTSPVMSVAFSPDGEDLASAGIDNSVRIWSVESGTLRRGFMPHNRTIADLSYSPDSRYLATASYEGQAAILNPQTGDRVNVLSDAGAMVHCVAFSPDGHTLAYGGADGRVRFYDLDTDVSAPAFVGEEASPPIITDLDCSSDGRWLSLAGEDGIVQVRDLESGDLLQMLTGHEDVVTAVAFSPEGQQLASASFDGTVRLWDPATAKTVQTFAGHTSWVLGVAWSHDGRRLATGGYDRSVRIWDATSGRQLATLEGHTASVHSVVWSTDDRFVASASGDRTVRIWDVAQQASTAELKGHSAAVRSVDWHPSGDWLASAGEDGELRLWSPDGSELHTEENAGGMLWNVTISPRGKTLVATGRAGFARLWTVDGKTLTEPQDLTGGNEIITTVAYAPLAKEILTGGYERLVRRYPATEAVTDAIARVSVENSVCRVALFGAQDGQLWTGDHAGKLKRWNWREGKLEVTLDADPAGVMRALLAPDGRWLATSGADGNVRLWAPDGKEPLALLEAHRREAAALAITPDGKRLFSGGGDNIIRMWNAENHRTLKRWPQNLPITSLEVSPDGQWLLSATGNWRSYRAPGEVTLWDTAKGQFIGKFPGHTAEVKTAVFSVDGNQVVSGCSDKKVRVFQRETQELVREWELQTVVTRVLCLPDGQTLLTGDLNGRLELWELSTGNRIRQFGDHQDKMIYGLSISPDQQWLATCGGDGQAQIWPLKDLLIAPPVGLSTAKP